MSTTSKGLQFPRPGGLELTVEFHTLASGTSVTAHLTGDDAVFMAYAYSEQYRVQGNINLWVGNAAFGLSSAEADQVLALIGEGSMIPIEGESE